MIYLANSPAALIAYGIVGSPHQTRPLCDLIIVVMKYYDLNT